MTKSATSYQKKRIVKKTPKTKSQPNKKVTKTATLKKSNKPVKKIPLPRKLNKSKKVPIISKTPSISQTPKPNITTKTTILPPDITVDNDNTPLYWLGPYGCLVDSSKRDIMSRIDGYTLNIDGNYTEMCPCPTTRTNMTKKKYLTKYTKKGVNGLYFYSK